MSNKSIRIRTTPDGKDKYVKVKLDQEFDFIEILSLKITQEEVYRNFCADYGVVVGRVFINNGFGIPNARVSIFIPIEDIDKDDPIINGLYPYEIVTDKDIDGKRYNLLPKNSETDNDCYTPVGTFPNKREVLDDPEMNYVYCKYYKFTTSTNYAGDYMIFGVPIGNHTIHVDVDISDIGIASQRPYDSISQGSPIQMFDSPTKFKGGTNLDRLIQVKSTNAGVNVQPFWGSVENCEIGISRIDLDINYEIKPSAIFTGGSFGDSDKNSVNKNCRPRRAMGKICEQVTSEGTIEMIRKTLDGGIEKLDIEGGRLIDENGAWAYQIPMNLDYYYTNEFGELVLSEDPNKGIPTRASVRFKVSMDETGGEGRLRTRANYLVPHNPNNSDEIDYEFGELTKDFSFRDLYWNKIYSVSNFITRYQRSNSINKVNDRNFVGLKDVDDCVGNKNPAPFNRLNTVFNPLFSIICLIMKIIEFIIWTINFILIPILNLVMAVINAIIQVLCGIIRTIRRILRKIGLRRLAPKIPGFCGRKYWVPCIGSFCPDRSEEDSKLYAPGCSGILNEKGRETLESNANYPIYSTQLNTLSDCVAFQMAKLLNLFQFDFFNDWLNGSLYFYLLKFKKRRRREKYCNYDCSNSCTSNIIIDTCYSDENDFEAIGVREGLIKKYNNELYYAPILKNGSYKMYATEVINLGSVFNCDWQGVPKIQQFLVPTTYSIPPTTDTLLDDLRTIETSGQVEIGNVTSGLFFSISCLGLKADRRQTLNIRHVCEFGVDLNETEVEPDGTVVEADHVIGSNEINSEFGKYVRDVFFGLNNQINNLDVTLPYSTDFNLCNVANYNFASDSETNPYATATDDECGLQQNGTDYVNFRGYLDNVSFSQPKHSFYFYFGTIPGATGLDKMNAKFFTRCFPELTLEFFIRIDETTPISQDGATDGTATFTIISGTGPFEYTISGPNGYNQSGTLTQPDVTQILINLAQGTYTINVTDSSNQVITQTFEIQPPIPLSALISVTSPNTALQAPFNGEITIFSIVGGNGTYTATLYNSLGEIVSVGACDGTVIGASSNPTEVNNLPLVFCGLQSDTAPNADPELSDFSGYYVTIEDDSQPPQTYTVYNLSVTGPSALVVTVTTSPTSCYDSEDGKIIITASGGIEPYEVEVITIEGEGPSFNTLNITNAPIGKYKITVRDQSNPIQEFTQIVEIKSLQPQMILIPPSEQELAKQCDPTKYIIKFKIQNGGADINGDKYLDRYSVAYYQLNFNETEDDEGNLIWGGAPFQAAIVNNNEFTVNIPASQVFSSVAIRLTDNVGNCGSNAIVDETLFDIDEMRLPPNFLTVNVDGVNNTRQCQPNQVAFKFNISHFPLTYRAPYTALFDVSDNDGSFDDDIPPVQSSIITSNQQQVFLITPNNGQFQAKVKFRVIDNVGCESPIVITNFIRIPTTQLTANWEQNGPPTSTSQCNKTITVSGGIPPYETLVGPIIPQGSDTATTTIGCNIATYAVIEDSVGCSITSYSN